MIRMSSVIMVYWILFCFLRLMALFSSKLSGLIWVTFSLLLNDVDVSFSFLEVNLLSNLCFLEWREALGCCSLRWSSGNSSSSSVLWRLSFVSWTIRSFNLSLIFFWLSFSSLTFSSIKSLFISLFWLCDLWLSIN